MTFTLTKTKLAAVIVAIVALLPATAYATHNFSDVPDGLWFTDSVEWAKTNGITTGVTPTEFKPTNTVTRAESVTFAHRYDTNVVQPALAAIPVPTAYGMVNADATLRGGAGVNSVEWELGQGRYVLNLADSYLIWNYTTLITPICDGHAASSSSLGGNLLVEITDTADAKVPCGFSFMTYKNPPAP